MIARLAMSWVPRRFKEGVSPLGCALSAAKREIARGRPDVRVLAVTCCFILFRLPALLNAGVINSDGAITGLQARHMLRGEWAWLHWGRDYLTSIDSLVATPFFAVFGSSPLCLMSVTLLGQLTSAWLAYAILRKRIARSSAVIAVSPTIFVTMAVNIYLFFDIRQWCLAIVSASFWLLDGAAESRRPFFRYGLGMFVGILATFVDLFAIQFVPGLVVFAVLCCFDGPRGLARKTRRLAVMFASLALALLTVRTLESVAGVSTKRASWELAKIPANFDLLRTTCLPWLIGSKVFALGTVAYPYRLDLPAFCAPIQLLGSVLFGCALVFGALSLFSKRVPWKVRRLGVLGSAVAFSSIAGFLVSTAAVDMWGARLLAPVVLALPFALAPAAFLLGEWRFGMALSPYLVTIAVGGWLSFGALVDGGLPKRTARGKAIEEAKVASMLRSRGIHYAAAHYWLAYRLTFLFKEDPVVVPLDSEDRYPNYRKAFDAAPLVAYVFHPSQGWLSPETYEPSLQLLPGYEKIKMFDFTILIFRHQP